MKGLASRYHNNDCVFSVPFVVSKLEALAMSPPIDARGVGFASPASPDWLISALHEGKIQHSTLFSAYHTLIESKLPPWSSSRAQCHLLRPLVFLVKHWMRESTFANGYTPILPCLTLRSDFPAKLVSDTITKYLSSVHVSDDGLVKELQALQVQLRSVS